MTDKDDTLRPAENLTEEAPAEESAETPAESPEGSIEPSKPETVEWDKEKGRLINAIGDKNKELVKKDDELKKLQKKMKEIEQQDMTDAEKYKSIAEDKSKENFELKTKVLVRDLLQEHGIKDNDPIAEIIKETPWAIPAVKKHLSSEPTWDETQEAIETYLPEYLESLKKDVGQQKKDMEQAPLEPSTVPESEPVDAERSVDTKNFGKKRIWTRREISALKPEAFAKHREEILTAMEEGRIIK